MPLYNILVPTRGDWQKKRDAIPVPKGASKVSIGDSIDPVHKSFSLKTAAQNVKDTDKLLANLAVYRSAVEKKYPKAVPVVDKIVKDAKSHKKVMEDIAKAHAGYLAVVRNAETVFIQGERTKWAAGTKPLGVQMLTLKGYLDAMGLIDDPWAKLAKEAGGWMNKCENLKTVPSATDIKGLQTFIDTVTG